jgi:hypothetical protein
MNRGLCLIVAFASLIVLAGCTVSVGDGGGGGDGDPFPNETAETVSVQPDFESPPVRNNVTLSAGESRLYAVDITQTVAQNNDVVYFDAVTEDPSQASGFVEVTVYEVVGGVAAPLYVSQTNEWFGHPDDPGLLSAAQSGDFGTAAVGSATPSCGGPCVVVATPSGSGTAYIRVQALQEPVVYDFFVVATDFSDLSEPNDTATSAEPVSGFQARGTIELIRDTDWFETQYNASQVTFNGNPDLNLLANVCTLGGSCRTLANGQTRAFATAQPVRVEVYSDEQQERAAAAGKALYSIDFQ